MRTALKSPCGLKARTTGIAALLLALASAHVASAQGNTRTGVNAGVSITIGDDNTADGFSALRFNGSGRRNTAVGSLSLRDNTSGKQNTAVGYGTLTVSVADNNTALG